GQYVYKFDISSGVFVRKSEHIFTQLQGIAIESSGDIWVYDRGVGTYGHLYKCNTDPIQVNQQNELNATNIASGAEATLISCILEVGTVIWFAVNGARVYAETCVWNVTIPTSTIAITLTPRTPFMGPASDGAGGSSDAEGSWVDSVTFVGASNDGYRITWTLPKVSLVEIDDSDYVGIVGKHTSVVGGGVVLAFEHDSSNNTEDVDTTVSIIKNDNTEFQALSAANNGRLYRLEGTTSFDDIDNAQHNSQTGVLYGTSSTARTLKRFAQFAYNATNGGNKSSTDSTTFDVGLNGSFTEASDTWHVFGDDGLPKWAKRVYSGSFGSASVVSQGRVVLTLAETSVTDAIFTSGKIYYYKACFVYDGYQESPLSDDFTITSTGKEVEVKINLHSIASISKRISHVIIFRGEGASGSIIPTGYYRYVKEFKVDDSFIAIVDSGSNPAWGNYRRYTFTDRFNAGASYEALVGISEIIGNTLPYYELSAQLSDFHFIGGCYHPSIVGAENYIFKSKAYKFNQFNWLEDSLKLPSKPTAMVGFNGRLYVFDENNTYRINPDLFFIEDTYEGVGCANDKAYTVTEYGMFFADQNNIYAHDGQSPTPIAEPILRSSGFDATVSAWLDMTKTGIMVGFDGLRKAVIISFNNSGYGYFSWAYNIMHRRWDLWNLQSGAKSQLAGKNGELYFSNGTNLYHQTGGSTTRTWEWYSGKLSMGWDTIDKLFSKLNLRGSGLSTTISGGDGTDSIQIKVDGSYITLTEKTAGTEYTLSSSEVRKGKYVEIRFENQASGAELDAIGMVYRRRAVK
ncbi:MAG: hypothetical protein HOG49_43400, partial [Candidatus Scalindua sp.]|nr:hypothetical protein [Candidatus Scalindua sp.]